MKKTTKMAGLVAGLMILAGITFTGCPDLGVGKDDFFGTWMTLDFDSDGIRKPVYEANGKYYAVRWFFNGKSENLSDGGLFRQHLVVYNTAPVKTENEYTVTKNATTVTTESYWFGKYDITGNSAYDKGKFFLNYEAGIDVKQMVNDGYVPSEADANGKKTFVLNASSSGTYKEKADAIVKVLDNWELVDYVNWAFGNTEGLENLKSSTMKDLAFDANYASGDNPTHAGGYVNNNAILKVRYNTNDTKILCSDIEYFRFNFVDAQAGGYRRMRGTTKNTDGTTIGGIYNQWATEEEAKSIVSSQTKKFSRYDAWKVKEGSAWSGTDTRYMGRIKLGTDDNPEWQYNKTTPNTQLFNEVDTGDSPNNYTDPDTPLPQ